MQMQHKMAANRAHQQQQRGSMNPYGPMYQHHQMQAQHMRSGMGPSTMTYPPTMGGMSMNSGNYGSAMYSAPSTAPLMPPTPARICNVSNEAQIISSTSLTPANIVFRKLPFFKVKHQILKPTILTPNAALSLTSTVRSSATQEFIMSFVLTCDMASDLAMHRDLIKNEYPVLFHIRITAVDNSTTTSNTEYDDFLPLGLFVRVNNRQCNTLPLCSPTTRQGVESRRIPRPIAITPLVRMSPMNMNTLIINWAHEAGKTFIVTLNIVEKLSSEFLLNTLKERPTIPIDVTKLSIRQQYKRVIDDDDEDATENADDDDIATTIVRVSLQCPLAKFRMQYPARGKNCGHLQCFDGSAYISLNEKKPMWMCPVCSRPLYYDDLVLDQYFIDVLGSDLLPEDCQEVQLFVDGSWKSYDEDNAENNENSKNQSNSPGASPGHNTSIVSTADSSDDTVDRKDVAVAHSSNENGTNAADPVVDLTCEDEEDPTEPVTNNEKAVTDSEDSPNSNAPVSLPAVSQPSDSEKAKETSPMDVSPSEVPCNVDTVASVISSAVEEAMNLPIISLDSPSPPSFPGSSTPALSELNIEDS